VRTFFFAFLSLFSAASVAAGEEPDLRSVRAAITRSIPWLERDMVDWRTNNDCSACHHGPMYLWSSHLALRQGYPIDRTQLDSYAAWIVHDPASRVFPASDSVARLSEASSPADRMTAAMMGRRNLSQPTLYLAHALNAFPAGDPLAAEGWRRLERHWSTVQMDDGSFAGRHGRPPVFNTPQILTRFAATALDDRRALAAVAVKPAALDRIRHGAAEFLRRQEPDTTHQGLVLQLVAGTQHASGHSDPQVSESLLARLRSLQRDDGGWSQAADRTSDAFATGQSLYALFRAGVPLSDFAVRRGLAYLAKSQAADGTWPMTSRPDPETGRPAGDLNPITYAAAAWAVIGMASYVRNEK
jgi:hypothetical protein